TRHSAGAGEGEVAQPSLAVAIPARRLAADESVARFPIRRPTELGPGLAEHEHHGSARPGMARDRLLDAPQQAHHADDGRRSDRAGGTLIVEGHVAARDRCAQGATRVGDATARLPELPEDGGSLRAAEVEAVGDAERTGAGAGDVARRLGDGRLSSLVRVEEDVARVAVGRDRDPEARTARANHPGVTARSDYRARLGRRIVLVDGPS